MDLSTVAGRAAAVAVVVSVLLWALREKCVVDALAQNKWLTRGVSVACVALGAAVADWLPDRALTFQTWLPVFVGAVPTTEFSYQWIVKSIGSLGSAKGPIIGAGCVLVALMIALPVPARAQTLGANAMLTGSGATKLAITASFEVGHIRGVDLWADGMTTDGGVGAGLSVPVLQVLQELGVGETVSWLPPVQALLEKVRGGACLVHTGGNFSGGAYVIYPIWGTSF